MVEPELGTVGAVAGNDVDVAVVVHGRCRIGHPYTGAASRARVVIGIGAPHVSRRVAVGELDGVKDDDPTRGGPLPLAATEGDHHRLRTPRFGHQNEGGALDLAVAVEAGSADIVAVDEDRTELVVGEVGHVEPEQAVGRPAGAVFITPAHYIESAGGWVDDGRADDAKLGVNGNGLEDSQVVARDRGAEPAGRELRAASNT